MYLSKLYIHGFKSFLNKTNLTFGEGITTVIGPNGCGKTNIVDAIRWILGEQKHKVLRSSRMEDVIFNGTKSRKPIGFCEVSINIQNNRGVLPSEYDQIELTRRLYRSGESEYLLNKVPCRLKDITNLFIDTGLGAHAYSVMELKMVDTILSYNPADRRSMFEEAAGVKQYKKQRKSTFRQLELIRNDLSRVKDILHEVEDKVHNLKLQLKRFERHKKLSSKLKSSEVLLSQIHIQKLLLDEVPIQQKLTEIKSRHSALSGQLNINESMIHKSREKFEIQKQKLDDLNREIVDTDMELRALNDNILIWTEKIKSNESRILQISDEQKLIKDRKYLLSNQIKNLESSITEILPDISESEKNYQELNDKLQSINNSLKKQEIIQNNKRVNYENSSRNLFINQAELKLTEEKVSEITQHLEDFEEEKKNIIDLVAGLQFDLEDVKTKIRLQEKKNSTQISEIEDIEKDRASAEDRLLSGKEKLMHFEAELKHAQNRLDFFEDILLKNEGLSDGAKYILSHMNEFEGVVGTISDIISVDKKYRKAIESALGGLTEFLVVDTYKNAAEIIKKIKKMGNLSVNLIPMDRIQPVNREKVPEEVDMVLAIDKVHCEEKYYKIIWYLLRHVIMLNSADEMKLIRSKVKNTYSFVTPGGEYFGFDHKIRIVSQKKESTIGRQSQAKDIKLKIDDIKKQIDQCRSENISNEKHANNLKKTADVRSKVLDEHILALSRLESKKNNITYQIKYNTDRIITLDNDYQASVNLKDASVKQHRYLLHEIDVISRENDQLKIELSDIEKLINKQKVNQNNIRQMVQDAWVDLVEVKKEFEGFTYRKDTAIQQLKELGSQSEKLIIESGKLDQSLEKLKSDLKDSTVEKNSLNKLKIDQLDMKVIVENDYNRFFEEMQELQEGVRDQQKIKEKSILEIQDCEVRLAEITKEKQLIQQRIRDKYNCEIPTEILNLSDISESELRQSIDAIDRSLLRIGPVNMAVRDEFEQESERLEFLNSQFNDLISSEGTLKETIAKIDEEVRSKFLTVFDEIRNNFKQTYSMFFEGGTAEIRLIGEGDPLESDIVITARPPGKRAQTLRMLSAGEKSLTAIALLFAIYLVKPSPFCILDEVDAPLDDTNIRIFTKVLKEFSESTQFIIITHNKLTMEKSDYLYGVTQEEEGVSSIVSVDFTSETVH